MKCLNCAASNPDNARFCLNCGSPLEAQRPVEGERRFVTVLFADVVGSTAMGEQLDPEQIAEIMNGAFSFLNRAVARFEGTVTRLLGDAILAIFGAPVAHEDDAERAVRAGLEIRAAAQEYGRRVSATYGIDFNIRVGINTGLTVLAVVGDQVRAEYTAMGDTANVAARLQAAAEPGTVLISTDTYQLVRHLFDVQSRGAIEVKGKSTPITVYEVLAVKPVPGKARGLDGLVSPLVGRDAEFNLLHQKLEDVQRGEGGIIALIGEAGLGKSRLLAEIRTLVPDVAPPTVVWLEGRALSYGQAITYYPWRQVIRQSIGAQEGDSPDTVREKLTIACDSCSLPGGDRPFLEALLAVESEQSLKTIMGLPGDALNRHIVEAIRGYIRGAAQMFPLVIVFDDLHWADNASLDLILNVSDLVDETRLLVICVLRPDKDAPAWALMERLRDRRGSRFAEISLEPLDQKDADQLLGNLLRIEGLSETTRSLILRRSDGNPFFLEEIIRSLIDDGYLVQENGYWRVSREHVEASIPESLVGVLSARIDRLPDDTKRVAQVAAVLGRVFVYRLLKAVCTTMPDPERIEDLEPHLQILTYEELVRERSRNPELEYIFKHGLTQEAAYNLLLLRRRKAFHRLAGTILEGLYADRLDEYAPTLAHHFWHGEDWPNAVKYALRAGTLAEKKLYALREAYEHFERAYQALEKIADASAEQISDVTLAWTSSARKFAPPEEILRRLGRAEKLAREGGDKQRLAQILHDIGYVHLTQGFPSRAMPALIENFQLAEELGDERISVVPSWFMTVALVDHDPNNALEKIDQVLELARRYQSKEIEANALGTRALAYARLGQFAEARADIESALSMVDNIESPVMAAAIYGFASLVYFDMGDLQKGLEYGQLDLEKTIAAQAMECVAAGYCAIGLGNLQMRRTTEALRAFEESLRFADEFSVHQMVLNQLYAGLAMARFSNGDVGAIQDMEESLTKSQEFGDEYMAARIREALGEAYTELERFDAAERHFNEALAYYRHNRMRPYLARTLRSIADLYEKQQRRTEADEAHAESAALMSELQALPT